MLGDMVGNMMYFPGAICCEVALFAALKSPPEQSQECGRLSGLRQRTAWAGGHSGEGRQAYRQWLISSIGRVALAEGHTRRSDVAAGHGRRGGLADMRLQRAFVFLESRT